MESTKFPFLTTLIFQFLFIIVDISCNVLSGQIFIRKDDIFLLIVYIVQDAAVLINLTLLGVSMFRTYIVKVGYIYLLNKRFRSTTTSSVLYLILTLTLQTITFMFRKNEDLKYKWGLWLSILYISQRFFAVLYYYFMKRSVLRLADPRFNDQEWVKHTIAHKE